MNAQDLVEQLDALETWLLDNGIDMQMPVGMIRPSQAATHIQALEAENAGLREEREKYGEGLKKLAAERAFGGLVGDMPALLMEAQDAVNRGRAGFRGVWPRGWSDQLYAQAAEAIRHVLNSDQKRLVEALKAQRAAEIQASLYRKALEEIEAEAINGANDLDDPITPSWDCSAANLPIITANVERFGRMIKIARTALSKTDQGEGGR